MNTSPLTHSRRKFIRNAALSGVLLPLANTKSFAIHPQKAFPVHIFSKHLQFLKYQDLADAAKEMGFDGVDLSVRPNGHVLPERVEEDLPKAAEALRKAGLQPSLMTTAIDDANDSLDRKVIETASKLGFKNYRMNWLAYKGGEPMPTQIGRFEKQMRELSLLNRQYGLTGMYQNHSGRGVGSNIWEVWQLLKEVDKQFLGSQYDIRHAMVEGAESWQNGFELIRDQVKSITVKDFKWGQTNGKWHVVDVPMGEGMVDFVSYFKLLKKYNIDVPVTLHIEYDLGGAQSGATSISIDKKEVFNAMKKDLAKVREFWQQA
jgi:sugar phosphate isomerase/epimerase